MRSHAAGEEQPQELVQAGGCRVGKQLCRNGPEGTGEQAAC